MTAQLPLVVRSLLLLVWGLRCSARGASAASAATTTATARCTTAATATATACGQGARRCAGARSTFLSKAAAAFRIFRQILLTFDAGGLGLFIAGGSFLESQRYVEIAPEVVCNGHRPGQRDWILDYSFVADVIGILERELFDDMSRVAVNRAGRVPPAGRLTRRIDNQNFAFPVADRIALI